MDPINDYTPIHGMIDSIAARAVVHLDNMTLGQHPDAAAREEGKLAAALAAAVSVVDKRSSNQPILASVLITADAKGVHIAATDMARSKGPSRRFLPPHPRIIAVLFVGQGLRRSWVSETEDVSHIPNTAMVL